MNAPRLIRTGTLVELLNAGMPRDEAVRLVMLCWALDAAPNTADAVRLAADLTPFILDGEVLFGKAAETEQSAANIIREMRQRTASVHEGDPIEDATEAFIETMRDTPDPTPEPQRKLDPEPEPEPETRPMRGLRAAGDWTEEQKARLREMWPDLSYSVEDISKEIGRTVNALRTKASSMDLGPRPLPGDEPKPVVMPARQLARPIVSGPEPEAEPDSDTTPAPEVAAKPSSNRTPCLKCRKPFKSEGNHHRVCDRCKKSDAWQNGSYAEPASVAL